jgi:hypothetical protein
MKNRIVPLLRVVNAELFGNSNDVAPEGIVVVAFS